MADCARAHKTKSEVELTRGIAVVAAIPIDAAVPIDDVYWYGDEKRGKERRGEIGCRGTDYVLGYSRQCLEGVFPHV